VGRQLPVFSIIIPAYLITVMAGWKKMTQILPAVLVTGVSFAIVQFLVSNFVGPELTDILAALVSMGSLAVLLRFWQPREVWQFAHETATVPSGGRRIAGEPDLPGRAAAAPRSSASGAIDPPARPPSPSARSRGWDRCRPRTGRPSSSLTGASSGRARTT